VTNSDGHQSSGQRSRLWPLNFGLVAATRLHSYPRPDLSAATGLAATALTALNDAITRESFARGIDCIDLRILCDDDRDFANPIEPSVLGGAKIAEAILKFAAPSGESYPRVIAR
jgi:hypothetical protein